MILTPDIDSFRALHDAGRAQVVWTTLAADLETPVSAMLKLAGPAPYAFLLDSVEGGESRGRYSIIGLRPDLVWRCRGAKAEINRRAERDLESFEPCAESSLDSLRALIAETRMELPARLPPMAAGLVGYMGYDMVRQMEDLPGENPDPLGLPDAVFARPTLMAIFDNVREVLTLIAPVWPQDGVSAEAAYAGASGRLEAAVADLDMGLSASHGRRAGGDDSAPPPSLEPTSNISREEYFSMVGRAREYIMAGDIFQVVLSQRFALPFAPPPFELYRALRRTNPSPFMYYQNFGDFAVVGASPEILVRLRGGRVTVRPIAGTRRRGADAAEDRALAAELLADPKERAEHLMLLDLGRNDVGRVAKIGTVEVTERMAIEHYSHVMHMVSNVEGEIDPKFDALDALIGGYPAGTVSGAPKLRAMEIIDELEPEKRGLYGGAVGYFSASGAMDTCIALRTALVKDGTMHFQAGGGIVADSDPEAEYQESLNKAEALVRAAEEALNNW